MKTRLLIFIFLSFSVLSFGFPKKSIIERYTNSSCGPCASINTSWYTATTASMVASGTVAHIVYNVNWPSAYDPMYLLNPSENAVRWTYYGVNSVPWIAVNGTTVNTDQSSMTSAVTNGNAAFSPFKLVITAERFVNKVITVKVKIIRDAADNAVYTKTKLKIGLTEKTVAFPAPLGNGESSFYSITRKMLPDAKGTLLTVPAPGDSTEIEYAYIPTSEFTSSVNYDSLRVVAFVQNDSTKMIYQSEMADVIYSKRVNSAFTLSETLGASPMNVNFTSYSSGSDTASITQYAWDFNNDGTIDSRVANPSYTYTGKQTFSVSLTVTDSKGFSHKRVMANAVKTIGKTADILVVNGIDYSNSTYKPEMTAFYTNAVVFGSHNVDIWDLFGDQEFNYSGSNAGIKEVHLYNRKIPASVLKLYKKVIWVGNNYSGDNAFFDPAQVIEYVNSGGNFVLATRWASAFFENSLMQYCGILSLTGDMTIAQAISLDPNLQSMASTSTNSFTHYVTLDTTTGAVKLFDDDASTSYVAGFRIRKNGNGVFVYIAGRPYRYNTAASVANYNYIIDNYLVGQMPTGTDDKVTAPVVFNVEQNYPNPFNPATVIKYSLPEASSVKVSVFNTLGQLVKVLQNESKDAGTYSVNFDASGLSSGTYIYTVTATSASGSTLSKSGKMLLMK